MEERYLFVDSTPKITQRTRYNDNITCIESKTETPLNETSLWNTAKKCKSVSLAFSEISFRNSNIVEDKLAHSDETLNEDIVERTNTKATKTNTTTTAA